MFAPEERDLVRERLFGLAAEDPAVVGVAVVGSSATGDEDRWSDLDLVFAVEGSLDTARERWTRRLYDEFGALHHWDLPAGATTYRVFLLAGGLEVDLAFGPPEEFAAHSPRWRTVFGQAREPRPATPPRAADLIGHAWHHALHARSAIARGRRWQAEHWIGALRTQTLALACLRLGLPSAYAKGAHLLPAEVTDALGPTLVRSLDDDELRRALRAAAQVLLDEIARTDAPLAQRLRPVLTEP
ncbi:hypothetical protein Val02_06810 [Virgisporangium aliadipatigenens]|uniref:Polymerase nucleotidyl transferase domain-containing protein n=2 Tax=Virgisporangium aliadipatigenens TaxID=741659 RepID=A0A8J4DMH4_9ACTN|nr:hypothetical protein Val02_06810 [Virgisporangium aliadipatigenens]